MTAHEIDLAMALGACRIMPGTSQKRFARDLVFIAQHEPSREISLRQRHYMEILAWRFRRQIPRHLVPQGKPLDLPGVIKRAIKGQAAKPRLADDGQMALL